MVIREITNYLEEIAPLSLQESYDNCGLIIGDFKTEVKGILITLDTTEDIVDEAISIGANLIISHHPIIFSGLKKLNGKNYIERTVIKAIKNDIAVYAIHTNLDNINSGVNFQICNKLNLKKIQILDSKTGELKKLVTFVPVNYQEKVRSALFEAGAGHIGNYNSCSYNLEGNGTFKALENANPFIGEINEIHTEKEIRIEVIFPKYLENKIISALIKNHPYEEVAYDIYKLDNNLKTIGAGMIGELETELDELSFLSELKSKFNLEVIKHTQLLNKKIKKVAVCGGSGSFLLEKAKQQKADIFITADIKYHQFFDSENQILIADIGHYESEVFTKDLIFDFINKKFPRFAVHFSKINTNPIKYF